MLFSFIILTLYLYSFTITSKILDKLCIWQSVILLQELVEQLECMEIKDASLKSSLQCMQEDQVKLAQQNQVLTLFDSGLYYVHLPQLNRTSSSTEPLVAAWLSLQFTKKPAIDTILLIIMRLRLGTKHSICCLLEWGNMGRACIWWHQVHADWTMMFHTKSTLDVRISCSFTSGVKTISNGNSLPIFYMT